MTTAQRVTMARLASDLGVSISTISNAYNRPEKLSPALRERILLAADELGYAGPDPFARGLHQKRSGGIGLVFTDEMPFVFSDPASSGFLAGVSEVLAENDHYLVLLPAGTPDRRRPAAIDRAALDGVILHSLPSRERTLELLRRRGAPTVLVDQPDPIDGMGWVGLDEASGMLQLGHHLARLGHRRVGFITSRLGTSPHDGPASRQRWAHSRFTIPRDRLRGLEHGLGQQVDVEERWSVTPADGAKAAAALLRRDPELTAIACIADTYALGVLDWARHSHIEVPHHLSVTGYDDAPSAAHAGLTTVRQPFTLKGRTAASALLAAIEEHRSPDHVRLTTEFVPRASSGSPLVSSPPR